jgi:hypothetical protein
MKRINFSGLKKTLFKASNGRREMRQLRLIWQVLPLFALAVLIGTTTSCVLKTPPAEVPLVQSKAELIPKTFFVNNPDPKTGKVEPKRFLFAWVPEILKRGGEDVGVYQAPMYTMHTNIEWRFTENYLEGLEIDPAYPSQPEKWNVLLKIKIKQHYYYEKEKDQYQRKKNKMIKNSTRDHWSRRPYVDLDLSQIRFMRKEEDVFWCEGNLSDVFGEEIDYGNGFLAFSAEAQSACKWGDFEQARLRFNIMEFRHKEPHEFKSTPYATSNSNFFNALHILGYEGDSGRAVRYAARWDLNETHDFYLNDVPTEYVPLIKKIVDEWNQTFEDIKAVRKGHKVFRVVEKKLKHPFDLRYPSLTWVSDRRISANSPLGIGLASADILNGEIKWGGIVIFGGNIEQYVNAVSPNESVLDLAKSTTMPQVQSLFDQERFNKRYSFEMKGQLNELKRKQDELSQKVRDKIDWLKLQKNQKSVGSNVWGELAALEQLLHGSPLLSGPDSQALYQSYLDEDYIKPQFVGSLTLSLKDMVKDHFSNIWQPAEEGAFANKFEKEIAKLQEVDRSDLSKAKQKLLMDNFQSGRIVDTDRTLGLVIDAWLGEIDRQQEVDPSFNKTLAIHRLIKHTVTHEFGHFVGLGHQFAGNILPKQGTVPRDKYLALKSKAEKDGTNFSSVMDYLNPIVEIRTPEEEIVPQEQDKLVLHYLYRQKYPYFDGETMDKFEFADVPPDGIIPEKTSVNGKSIPTAYFPACNDIEATVAEDPFCNRFDRGYNAETIAKGYIEDFNMRLPQRLNAFTDARGDYPRYMENYVFLTSLRHFGRLRLFNDYLRYKLDHEDPYKKIFGQEIRSSASHLYSFSEACIDPSKAKTKKMKKTFMKLALKHPEQYSADSFDISQVKSEDLTLINDLCRANKLVMEQYGYILRRLGSDRTVVDYDDRVMPGGMSAGTVNKDWSRMEGRWKEIGTFPVKFSALYYLTTPTPAKFFGWWAFPKRQYSNSSARYSYFGLYPREFTEIINTTVKHNLRTGNPQLNEPVNLGLPIHYLPFMLAETFSFSGDNKQRFPQDYLENIREQTEFSFNPTPIILKNVEPSNNKGTNRVYRFQPTFFDQAKRTEVKIPYAYLLPERRVIAKGLTNQFFLPITRFRYLSEDWGYVWAFELSYTQKDQDQDPLMGVSAKLAINKKFSDELERCVYGSSESGSNGLATFFSEDNPYFKGLRTNPRIATSPEHQWNFDEDLRNAFRAYWGDTEKISPQAYGELYGNNPPIKQTCEDAVKVMEMSIGAGALLNGYWIPQMYDYISH